MRDFETWVFGYGSLMWHPEFEHDEAQIATLKGYRRGFIMRSIHHRGTQEFPGLVLALDKARGDDDQATCTGLAFRVRAGCEETTMAALRERELVSYAYKEVRLTLDLADKRQVVAVTYVIDPNHVQYCGALPPEDQAQIIAKATGGRGPNSEYLFNTHTHLGKLGIKDDGISWLAQRVRALTKA